MGERLLNTMVSTGNKCMLLLLVKTVGCKPPYPKWKIMHVSSGQLFHKAYIFQNIVLCMINMESSEVYF